MAKNSSSGGGKGALLFVLFLLLAGVSLGAYFFLEKNGFLDRWEGWDRLVERTQSAEEAAESAENRAEVLAAENARLRAQAERTNPFVLWGLAAGLAIVVLMLFLVMGSATGRNITLDEAIVIARERIARPEWGGWRYYREVLSGRHAAARVWRQLTPYTGQAVEGDIDSIWFVLEFAADWSPGSRPPDAQCISVLVRSNDPSRQIIVERLANASSAAKKHGLRLQKSAQPTSLATALQEASAGLAVERILRGDEP